MNKEELLKEIMKLPKAETDNPISTMNSINVDDLMSAVDRLNKVPDYNDLLKENQELKKQLKKLERGKWIKDSRKQIENKLIENIDNVETLGDILNYLDSLYFSIDNQLYKIKIHKNQQKEFIKYLEDEIKQINPKILDDGELNLRLDDIKFTQYLIYKEVLQKYRSIIGGNDV